MLIVELLFFSHQFQFAWFMDSDSILPYGTGPSLLLLPILFFFGGGSGEQVEAFT